MPMGIETVMLAVQPDVEETNQLVDTAIDIAEPTGASVIIAVVHSEESYEAANEDFDGKAAPDELAKRNQHVTTAVNRLNAVGVHTEIQAGVGDVGPTLVSIADDVNADLMLIREQGRSPAGKALFGSVAQTVLLNAHCPVTFVRR